MKKASLLLTMILSVSIAQAQVGINTTEPQAALHVEGDLIVTETPLAEDNTSIEPLYIDSLGRFVKPRKEEASSPAFVINTRRDMLDLTVMTNDLSLFNNAKYVTFPIGTSDVIINNLGMSIENQVIRVGKTGLYKIDSSINFRFASSTSGSKLFIHIVLEKSNDNGQTWEIEQGFRPIITIELPTGQVSPIVFPTVTGHFNEGELLRFAFARTEFNGTLHGDSLSRLQIVSVYWTPSFQFSMTKL